MSETKQQYWLKGSSLRPPAERVISPSDGYVAAVDPSTHRGTAFILLNQLTTSAITVEYIGDIQPRDYPDWHDFMHDLFEGLIHEGEFFKKVEEIVL
jgi:hypothetical protein